MDICTHTYIHTYIQKGILLNHKKTGASQVKGSACQRRKCKRCEFDPWVGKILWSKKWNHSSMPAWMRSLVGCAVHGAAMSRSTKEENEIMPFAVTQMDLETIVLSQVNQTEREKYQMISLLCGI